MPDPATAYRARREGFAGREATLARRSRALSWARLAVALAVVFLLVRILLSASAPPAWPFVALAVAVAAFGALAVAHDRVIRRQRRWHELAALNADGLARLERRWEELPPSPPPPPEALDADGEPPPVVRDLSLFGPASLARLLGTVRTPSGRLALARWLLAPAEPDEVRRRQPAVAELAAAVDLRQDLELAGRLAARSEGAGEAAGGDREAFLAWAEGEPWLLRRPGLVWAARLLPVIFLALAVAAVAGAVPASLAGLVLVGNLVLSYALRGRLEERFERVSAGTGEIRAYAGALEVLAGRRFEAPKLAALAAELTGEGDPAARWMRRLARGLEIADARHGSFHVVTQVLTLWDLHALHRLERWQRSVGARVRRWLDAVGEMEALAALGTLSHDHPDWAFPAVITAGEARLDARGLAHPLLARPVGNDVTVGPPGTFLLVTGSNMSGKSTLLRALGLNVTLAQAGGPVCADALALPPVTLGTSILVEDSLADGVSFFLAELLRLKEVVDGARSAREAGRTPLYLLDEVLRGTNSRERREAVVRVLGHLLEAGAVGALSTHDLELGTVPEIADAARAVHFRETVHPPGEEGPVMTFDYRLRPGPATTTNALALMEAVGLAVEEPGGREGDRRHRAAPPERS